MHLYLNCIGNKNSTQPISVGVVVGFVKKLCCHQNAVEAWDMLYCSEPPATCTLQISK